MSESSETHRRNSYEVADSDEQHEGYGVVDPEPEQEGYTAEGVLRHHQEHRQHKAQKPPQGTDPA